MVLEIDRYHFRGEVEIDAGLREVLCVAQLNLFFIGDERFGELGSVDGEIGLESEDGDLAIEALFAKTFYGANRGGTTFDNFS